MSGASNFSARVLCLGNDILADDGLGLLVFAALKERALENVDVVESMESGLRLMDHLLDVPRVVVVDVIETQDSNPGHIHILKEGDVPSVSGGSPHYVGLFEALDLGRALGLTVAQDLIIVAVEAADCRTLDGPMHPAVAGALPEVTKTVCDLLH